MKAITIKQPFASLIVTGLKDVENRSWKTSFRGRVLVHAAKTPVKDGWSALNNEQMKKVSGHKDKLYWNGDGFPNGAIVGSVEIVDCVKNHPSIWADKGLWNWVLANPVMFPEPVDGVKGKLSFWEYDGELPKPKQEKPKMQPKMPDIEALRENAFRRDIVEGARKMIERLTVEEQLSVSFLPLVLTHIAWVYADKAMSCAARDRVTCLKKLGRALKDVRQRYGYELRRDLDFRHVRNVEMQTEMCMEQMSSDLNILYFSVNQELKRKVPDYGYDELRTYAVISTLFVELLEQHNREMDRLLAERLEDRKLAPSIVPPLIQQLYKGMVAFAGVEGKFDYRERNVVMAMKVIKNRIGSIEFSVF